MATSLLTSNDPVLHAAAVRAQQLGEAHGWSPSTTRCVFDGLVTVLDGRPAGERVPMSDIRTRTHRRVSKPRLAEVLAELGLLDDDTTPAIHSWIDGNTDSLAPGFAEPVRRWLITLIDGDARSKPRTAASAYAYLGSVRPFLEHWATRYGHLREVTKNDIYAGLDPLHGYQRNNAICALRSLFRFAKKRGLTFSNPTTGVKGRPVDPDLVPMTGTEIRAIGQLAAEPAQRLAVALAAEHAARTSIIRHLTLGDLDMPNRRITLDRHNQRLGELTYRALRAWLDHRRVAWPRTPNRHVLVNAKTVLNTGPVSGQYIRFCLGRNGFSIDRIRADRFLHEALTAVPDPLHLSLVFNISHATATPIRGGCRTPTQRRTRAPGFAVDPVRHVGQVALRLTEAGVRPNIPISGGGIAMSDRAGLLLHKALQTLEPDERDELLHALLLGRLGTGTFSPAGLLGAASAPRFPVNRERLASLLGFGFDASSPAGAPLKVLPVRLPEANYEQLREFCQASGFSMAVVIRTLVERFLDQQAAGSGRA